AGFALLPKDLVAPFIEKKALTILNAGRSTQIPFALTWYPRKEMPDYFKALIKAIK
ncbi:MAG: LysR family transcriptional regulator, partial [Bdellovibrio sp.]